MSVPFTDKLFYAKTDDFCGFPPCQRHFNEALLFCCGEIDESKQAVAARRLAIQEGDFGLSSNPQEPRKEVPFG
jgi:hypothetical protein